MKFATVPIEQVPPLKPDAETTPHRPLVLVVDHKASVADSLVETLTESGYAAVAVYDGPDAIETAQIMPPELLIADIELPGMSGIELAEVVKSTVPDCKIVLLSGQASKSELLARVSESLKR
jgi:CheY-like chemotaxis protein